MLSQSVGFCKLKRKTNQYYISNDFYGFKFLIVDSGLRDIIICRFYTYVDASVSCVNANMPTVMDAIYRTLFISHSIHSSFCSFESTERKPISRNISWAKLRILFLFAWRIWRRLQVRYRFIVSDDKPSGSAVKKVVIV